MKVHYHYFLNFVMNETEPSPSRKPRFLIGPLVKHLAIGQQQVTKSYFLPFH